MNIELTIRDAIQREGVEGQTLLQTIAIEGAGLSDNEAELLLSVLGNETGHYECFGQSLGGAAAATLVLRSGKRGVDTLIGYMRDGRTPNEWDGVLRGLLSCRDNGVLGLVLLFEHAFTPAMKTDDELLDTLAVYLGILGSRESQPADLDDFAPVQQPARLDCAVPLLIELSKVELPNSNINQSIRRREALYTLAMAAEYSPEARSYLENRENLEES